MRRGDEGGEGVGEETKGARGGEDQVRVRLRVEEAREEEEETTKEEVEEDGGRRTKTLERAASEARSSGGLKETIGREKTGSKTVATRLGAPCCTSGSKRPPEAMGEQELSAPRKTAQEEAKA